MIPERPVKYPNQNQFLNCTPYLIKTSWRGVVILEYYILNKLNSLETRESTIVNNLEIMTFGKVEGLVMYNFWGEGLGKWSSCFHIILTGSHEEEGSIDRGSKKVRLITI